MTDLENVLEANRPQIEKALDDAEQELATLDRRRDQLLQLIVRAKSALGEPVTPTDDAKQLTLHEAIATILRESGNEWTHVKDLAEAVNKTGLYKKRDGSPLQSNQIHARTKNYEGMFEKDGPQVRLKENVNP